MDVLNQLFSTFKVTSEIFHNGQYCGNWALDTSGSKHMTFHIVNHGNCLLTIDGDEQVYELNEGDIVLFPTDISHRITNDGDPQTQKNIAPSFDFEQGKRADATGLICGYFQHQHPLMGSLVRHLPNLIILKPNSKQLENSSLSYLLGALIEESLSATQGSALVMNKVAEALLAIIFRQHLPTNQGLLAALVHPKLNKVIQAIHGEPERKWTVDNLANLCFMSRVSFNNLFKSIMQQSPMDYVTQWRISVAYRMLKDDKSSILEAAIACGYENESSFSKAFKRTVGQTPGAIRNQLD